MRSKILDAKCNLPTTDNNSISKLAVSFSSFLCKQDA